MEKWSEHELNLYYYIKCRIHYANQYTPSKAGYYEKMLYRFIENMKTKYSETNNGGSKWVDFTE